MSKIQIRYLKEDQTEYYVEQALEASRLAEREYQDWYGEKGCTPLDVKLVSGEIRVSLPLSYGSQGDSGIIADLIVLEHNAYLSPANFRSVVGEMAYRQKQDKMDHWSEESIKTLTAYESLKMEET